MTQPRAQTVTAAELRAGETVIREGAPVRLSRDPEPYENHPNLLTLPLYGTGESEAAWIMRADRQVQRVDT